VFSQPTRKGEVMGNVTTVGIDLAKNVFSLHGVDTDGAVVLRKTVSRARLLELVAQQPACLIGLEACSGAHEWARRFQALGHTVKLMAPRFVAPYRKNGKNDGNDAEAICEAVSRPSARAAGGAVRAPCAPGVYRGTYGDDQSAARPAGGVWFRVATTSSRSAPQRG
jgi:hypothetical protein